MWSFYAGASEFAINLMINFRASSDFSRFKSVAAIGLIFIVCHKTISRRLFNHLSLSLSLSLLYTKSWYLMRFHSHILNMMRSAASRHLCITFWSKEDERKMNNNIKKTTRHNNILKMKRKKMNICENYCAF